MKEHKPVFAVMQQVDFVHNHCKQSGLMLFPAVSKASLFKLMQCLYNVMQRQSCRGNKDLNRKKDFWRFFLFPLGKNINMFSAIFACKCKLYV